MGAENGGSEEGYRDEIQQDRCKFDSGQKGRINGAGGTLTTINPSAQPEITGSQVAKYDGPINSNLTNPAPPNLVDIAYVCVWNRKNEYNGKIL